MIKKEQLGEVFQSYNSIKDKMAWEAAKAQEEARSKAIEYEEKVKREKFEAERKLAETGVIDLLVGIRDSGLVMYRKK